MKLLNLITIMALLLVSTSLAATLTVDDALEEEVEMSNPRHEDGRDDDEFDDDKELSYAEYRFTYKPTQNVTIESITTDLTSVFSYEPFSDELNDSYIYEINDILYDQFTPVEVEENKTYVFTVKALIPNNLDVSSSSFTRNQFDFTVDVNTNVSSEDASQTVGFTVESMLQIKVDIDIETPTEDYSCDINEDSTNIYTIDCDDTLEIRPGEEITLSFVIENIWKDEDQNEIEVEFDVADDGDWDNVDDIDDEDLSPEDEVTITLKAEADTDAEDDGSIIIEIRGTDENEASYGFELIIDDFEFQVPNYDVEITSLGIFPTQVCEGEMATIEFEVENVGAEEQDNVRLVFENSQLQVREIIQRISLEEEDKSDNDYQGSVSFSVPSTAAQGTYPIAVTMYYEDEDNDDAFERSTLELLVDNCYVDESEETDDSNNSSEDSTTGSQTDTTGTNTQGSNNNGQSTNTQTNTTTTQPTTPVVATVTPQQNNGVIIAGLIVAAIVLLGLIGLLVAVLLKK